MRLRRLFIPLVVVALASAAALVSGARAGGIADEPCPTVAGEHTNTCPAGTVGVPYALKFKEAPGSGCGPGQQTFTVDSGNFPPGLSLASDGSLSGTPTAAGNFVFYIKMAEKYKEGSCAGEVTDKRFTIPINPASAPPPLPKLVIGPEQDAVPAASVGTPFSLTMTANLSDPKTWSIVAGSLPAGLTLGAGNGVISGTPAAAGTYGFTVQAVLADQRSDTRALAITVRERLVLEAPKASGTANGLPSAEVGVHFSAPFSATGGFGTYTWSIAAGALPPGLALAPNGAIAGRPATAGRYGFTVSVKDAEGRTATYNALVRVAQRLDIVTQLVRRTKVGRLYNQKLKTAGGVNPKTWRVKKGRLPRGIRLSATLGVFTGRPQQAGRYRVTVEVTDALGVKSTQTLALVVLP